MDAKCAECCKCYINDSSHCFRKALFHMFQALVVFRRLLVDRDGESVEDCNRDLSSMFSANYAVATEKELMKWNSILV